MMLGTSCPWVEHKVVWATMFAPLIILQEAGLAFKLTVSPASFYPHGVSTG